MPSALKIHKSNRLVISRCGPNIMVLYCHSSALRPVNPSPPNFENARLLLVRGEERLFIRNNFFLLNQILSW